MRLFCSNLLSVLGLATTVVDPLALPSCLVLLEVRRSYIRCLCSPVPTPSLLMDPWLDASSGHVHGTFAITKLLRTKVAVLRGGTVCECTATIDTLIRDHCDSQL